MRGTSVPSSIDGRRPAWLLILTLPVFMAFLGLAVATIATQADSSSAELTPAQLADLGLWWVALHLLWITPTVLAAVGLSRLARAWRLTNLTAVQILCRVAVTLAACYLVVQVLALRFEGDVWGHSSLYAPGVVLSMAAGWTSTLPATILVCVSLTRHDITRKTAWTIAALTALFLAFEVAASLSALLQPADLSQTAGPPPFLLGFFWAALGVGLLRHGTSSQPDHGVPDGGG